MEKGLTDFFHCVTVLRSSRAPARMYTVYFLVFSGAWGCGEGTFVIGLLLSKDTKALDKIPLVEGKEKYLWRNQKQLIKKLSGQSSL